MGLKGLQSVMQKLCYKNSKTYTNLKKTNMSKETITNKAKVIYSKDAEIMVCKASAKNL